MDDLHGAYLAWSKKKNKYMDFLKLFTCPKGISLGIDCGNKKRTNVDSPHVYP